MTKTIKLGPHSIYIHPPLFRLGYWLLAILTLGFFRPAFGLLPAPSRKGFRQRAVSFAILTIVLINLRFSPGILNINNDYFQLLLTFSLVLIISTFMGILITHAATYKQYQLLIQNAKGTAIVSEVEKLMAEVHNPEYEIIILPDLERCSFYVTQYGSSFKTIWISIRLAQLSHTLNIAESEKFIARQLGIREMLLAARAKRQLEEVTTLKALLSKVYLDNLASSNIMAYKEYLRSHIYFAFSQNGFDINSEEDLHRASQTILDFLTSASTQANVSQPALTSPADNLKSLDATPSNSAELPEIWENSLKDLSQRQSAKDRLDLLLGNSNQTDIDNQIDEYLKNKESHLSNPDTEPDKTI